MSLLGRALTSFTVLACSLGAFAADWSETHVFNPRWPPHAKFHNGQTMSMGALLALATLWYTWRAPHTVTRDSTTAAALLATLYPLTGSLAILYPGAAGMDPEFGEGNPQGVGFGILSFVPWLGWWLERRALGL